MFCTSVEHMFNTYFLYHRNAHFIPVLVTNYVGGRPIMGLERT